MEENQFDVVKDEIINVVGGATKEIGSMFKGTNPFNKKQIPKSKLTEAYSQLTDYEKQAFIVQYKGAALELFSELEGSRRQTYG